MAWTLQRYKNLQLTAAHDAWFSALLAVADLYADIEHAEALLNERAKAAYFYRYELEKLQEKIAKTSIKALYLNAKVNLNSKIGKLKFNRNKTSAKILFAKIEKDKNLFTHGKLQLQQVIQEKEQITRNIHDKFNQILLIMPLSQKANEYNLTHFISPNGNHIIKHAAGETLDDYIDDLCITRDVKIEKAFKIIYEALYVGQSGFFNTNNLKGVAKLDGMNAILKFVSENKRDKKLGKALELAQKYYADMPDSHQYDCHFFGNRADNKISLLKNNLFLEIYQFSFERSWIFARSKLFVGETIRFNYTLKKKLNNESAEIDDARADPALNAKSRSAKIISVLYGKRGKQKKISSNENLVNTSKVHP